MFEELLVKHDAPAVETNAIEQELLDFARRIRTGRQPSVTGADGRDAVAVAEVNDSAARATARLGRRRGPPRRPVGDACQVLRGAQSRDAWSTEDTVILRRKADRAARRAPSLRRGCEILTERPLPRHAHFLRQIPVFKEDQRQQHRRGASTAPCRAGTTTGTTAARSMRRQWRPRFRSGRAPAARPRSAGRRTRRTRCCPTDDCTISGARCPST